MDLVSQLAPKIDRHDVGGPEPAKAAAPRRCREQVPIFLGEYELPQESLVFGPAVSFHGRPPFCYFQERLDNKQDQTNKKD